VAILQEILARALFSLYHLSIALVVIIAFDKVEREKYQETHLRESGNCQKSKQ
jgi:hypothetical protein